MQASSPASLPLTGVEPRPGRRGCIGPDHSAALNRHGLIRPTERTRGGRNPTPWTLGLFGRGQE